VHVVGDEREAPARLGHAGRLAARLPGAADRGGGLLVDDEHAGSLGARAAVASGGFVWTPLAPLGASRMSKSG
jgi:hypothetical protein